MESDERFKHLASDPRFKTLRRRQRKVQIDERFKSMFTDERFGRRDNLEKFYQIEEKEANPTKEPESNEAEGDDGEIEDEIDNKTAEDEDSEQDDEDADSELEGEQEESSDRQSEPGSETPESDLSSSSDESESEVEQDEEANLDQQIQYDWQPLDYDAERTETKTHRLAILNLDWNNLDINDVYVLLNSIRPPLSIKLYISEFGKERLAKEAVDGPDLPEIDEVEDEIQTLEDQLHRKKANQYEDADDMYNIKDEAIRERLRQYQLNQMKYYYAIAEFDSVESAQAVYKELDGIEYEGSSLELDLRFVPNDMSFDPADVKAECNKVPDLATYKAPQFIASALQQTTVKFTWDETDIKRQEKLRKAYTKEELEKDDLDAYLASDTEDEDDEANANKYKELVMQLDEAEAAKKRVDVDVEWNEDDDDDDSGDDDDDGEDDDDDDNDDNNDEDDEGDDHSDVNDSSDQDDDSDNDKNKEAQDGDDVMRHEKENGTRKEDGLDLIAMDFKEPEEFRFNPDDDRFKAVYESGLYNLDPSHPSFKQTEATKLIAEKKREKRRRLE